MTMRDAAAENRLDRRTFLQGVGMVGLAAALPQAVADAQIAAAQFADVKGADLKTPSGKPLRGLYPIMETPFTPEDKLNTDALAAEVKWLNKGRVAGMIWPAWASGWATMSDAERIEGTEAILAAGKGGRSCIVIEVQNNAWDTADRRPLRQARGGARRGRHWRDTAEQRLEPERPGDPRLLQGHRRSHRPSADCAVERHGERGPDGADVSTDPDHEGDQGRGRQHYGARAATDRAHRQQAGGVVGGRWDRRPTAGKDATGDCGTVPNAAVRRAAAAGDGTGMGGQEERGLRHVRARADVCGDPRRDRVHDGGARRLSGGDEVAAAAHGAGGTACRSTGGRRSGGRGGPVAEPDPAAERAAAEAAHHRQTSRRSISATRSIPT